jgi:uncharacterized membrane protein
VLGGESLSFADRRQIDAALATAKRFSDLDFDAYLGPAGDDAREHALALHGHLARPEQSVLVLCDPDARALEIVTGQATRQYLDDAACRLAVATMTSSFLAGDLVGGLVRGIQQLGEAAHHPQTLHAAGII